MHLNSSDIVVFLLSIGIVLLFSRGLGELFKRFKQPIIIGEIIAGIVLGPTILGVIAPDYYNYLFTDSVVASTAFDGITILGLAMLLLVLGLEIDLRLALSQGKAASLVSLFGILFPFTLGFLFAYFFPSYFGIADEMMRFIFALFIGVALSITALPVIAKTLMDLNMFKTKIGTLIITSAMFNDLIGWLIFSIILGAIGRHSHDFGMGWILTMLFIFVFFTLIIGRKIINYFIPYLEKFTTYPGGILNFIFIVGFLCAAFTEYIGVHAIFGAFIIGIAIGDSAHLKEQTREVVQQFVTNIFAPIFFVSIGLKVNFITNFDFGLVAIFITLAFIGKVAGCGFGAYLGGKSVDDSLIIGFGMNSHGAIEIILGTIALQAGLIHERVFVALVFMALVTTISSAPLMNFFIKRKNAHIEKKISNLEQLP